MKRSLMMLLLVLILVFLSYLIHQSVHKDIATPEDIAEAEERCLQREGELPEKTFTSDGCTLVPDWKVLDCCIEHDMDYWCGGSEEERDLSDQIFGQCVREKSEIIGTLYWIGVRMGSALDLPTPWRWGYGHEY